MFAVFHAHDSLYNSVLDMDILWETEVYIYTYILAQNKIAN